MGTGSGAIGIIIAKRTRTRVVCTDVSLDALSVAKQNASVLRATDKIVFLCSDLFGGIRKGETFDMVIANLPYVSPEDWSSLMVDVKEYEPKTALLGGRGGLGVYRSFAKELPYHLKEDGHVLCEIDGKVQAEQLGEMLSSVGLNIVTKKDYSQRERVLIGAWTSSS